MSTARVARAEPSPTRATRVTARTTPARLVVAEGVPEALKWIALVLMTADHINKFLFAEQLPFVFEAGRVSMPLFAFVLAYNLARPETFRSGGYERTLTRLLLWGAISTPFFFFLVGWWPLNIMFTLALSTAVCWLIERGGRINLVRAAELFLTAGVFVEFWWPAVALTVAAWWFCRRPSWSRMALVVLACVGLWGVNRNYWALMSLPVAWLACAVKLRVPRLRTLFYVYYPLHLGLLLAVSSYLS